MRVHLRLKIVESGRVLEHVGDALVIGGAALKEGRVQFLISGPGKGALALSLFQFVEQTADGLAAGEGFSILGFLLSFADESGTFHQPSHRCPLGKDGK